MIQQLLDKLQEIPINNVSRDSILRKALDLCGISLDWDITLKEVKLINLTKKVIKDFTFGSDETSVIEVFYFNDKPHMVYTCSGDHCGMYRGVDIQGLTNLLVESLEFVREDAWDVLNSLEDLSLDDYYVKFNTKEEVFELNQVSPGWYQFTHTDSGYKLKQ